MSGEKKPAKILIVDDEPFNVDYLEQELEDLGYDTVGAKNGKEALELVEVENPDMILLDIMMPILDGFGVLQQLREHSRWRDIPVVVISAVNDIDSIVKGIELGADDYLPKPFDEVLLKARIEAGLERKRLRDLEREYLDQVQILTEAALAIEEDQFDAASVSSVAEREDALGHLARVFQHMAEQVHAREQFLRQQIRQLQIDIHEQQTSAAETIGIYVPIDRRIAISKGETLPRRTQGAAMFVDISGFTRLAQALVQELGEKRGAEELTRQLNQVYEVLIHHIHRFGGGIIGFAGDSVTCWFDVDSTSLPSTIHRTVTSAFALQEAMQAFQNILVSDSFQIHLSIKISITAGNVQRFLVGSPEIQYFEVIAGGILNQLAEGEQLANKAEIIVSGFAVSTLTEIVEVEIGRIEEFDNQEFAVISRLQREASERPWVHLPAKELNAVDKFRPWLAPAVFEHVYAGKSSNLSQFRETTSLFLYFSGLEYETNDDSPRLLDEFVQWVQKTVDMNNGMIVQVTIGDKGSYLFIVFGAPVALPNHALAAVKTALKLRESIPFETPIHNIRMGIASGIMRSGAYGSSQQRTYGNQGPQTNLAARLMQAASIDILCDQVTYDLTRHLIRFDILSPIDIKGYAEPVSVYRPTGTLRQPGEDLIAIIDRLSPESQLVLKLMSVFNCPVDVNMLRNVHPNRSGGNSIQEAIALLLEAKLVVAESFESVSRYVFLHDGIRQTIYDSMLFGQRRQLHREIALWCERTSPDDLEPHYNDLAHHWEQAEDYGRAISYLEKAATEARRNNEYEYALQYFDRILALQSRHVETIDK